MRRTDHKNGTPSEARRPRLVYIQSNMSLILPYFLQNQQSMCKSDFSSRSVLSALFIYSCNIIRKLSQKISSATPLPHEQSALNISYHVAFNGFQYFQDETALCIPISRAGQSIFCICNIITMWKLLCVCHATES